MKSYEVGYKKTPEHTRFKPGQSGNPKGRPKKKAKAKSAIEMLVEELDRKYPLEVQSGKAMRAKRVIFRQAVRGAMKGGKDAQTLIKLIINADKLAHF